MEVTKTLLPSKAAWYLEFGDHDAYAVAGEDGEFALYRDPRGERPHAASEHARLATGGLRAMADQLRDWAVAGAIPRPCTGHKHPWFVIRVVDRTAALTGYPAGRAIAYPDAEAAEAARIRTGLDGPEYGIQVDKEPWPPKEDEA